MSEYLYWPGSFVPQALLTREEERTQTWHYHCDPNGAPFRLTSPEGDIVWSGQDGVWGERNSQPQRHKIDNPLRFQGQYYDAETGLHYNRHRYYDPHIAAYISQDPIGLAGGINPYQYAPNPLMWVDPLGLYKGEGQRGLGKYHVFHEYTLNPAEYTMTDKEHFSRANESVYQRLQTDAEFKRELQTKYPGVVDYVQPMRNGNFRGASPKGMTWHHGDSPGSLQLADFNDHKSYHKIYHPSGAGGRNKWGGGTKCRK